jgi:hypothetical protein
MVYDTGLAVAAIFHIMFGALYFGSDIFAEFVLFRGLDHAESVGEVKVFQKLFKRAVPIFILSALGTLLTGLVYLGVKYRSLDPGYLWGYFPPARLILVALLLFVVLFVIAARVLAPSSKKLIERDFGADLAAPVPPDFKETLAFMGKATHLQTALIVIVIVLMILAANGGL